MDRGQQEGIGVSDGRWRRVYSLSWQQSAVQGLSDSERVTWLYLQTGPQSTSVGIYRLSTALAVEDLGNVAGDEFERRLGTVCEALQWQFDPTVRVLWMPDWLQMNPPQSPNVAVSWRKLLNNVPDCVVKANAVAAIHRFLKDMPEAFREAFGRYAVNLPEDIQKSKSKPKSNQGSGIRDLGIQGIQRSSVAPLMKIAGEVLRTNHVDDETALDAFLYLARQSQIDVNRATAIQILEKSKDTRRSA